VDGLRALAALWVVLFHIYAFSHASFPHIPGLNLFLSSGSTGVSLFLVLSGFCLYLPFAAGRSHRFKVGQFFRRRCWRLLPAYYVSLMLALVLAYVMAGPLGEVPPTPGEAAWQTLSHLALLHTLFPNTFYSLNGAYWSLGLEWQLYLALPLLIWGARRYGLAPTVCVAVACNIVYRLALGKAIGDGLVDSGSILGFAVLPNQLPGRWAEFVFGMVAAELYASGRLERWSRYVPAALVAIVLLIPASVIASRGQLGHIVFGVLFCTVVCVVVASDNPVSRAVSWRPLVFVGTISYSLYLVHQPVIQFTATWLDRYRPDLSPTAVFVILLACVPGILVLAWTLFVAVERRTIGRDTGLPLPSALRVAASTVWPLTIRRTRAVEGAEQLPG
jgi:peptidoglycan/LPS O-acetylase OafA/YrhL